MVSNVTPHTPTPAAKPPRRRKHHWLRWLLVGIAALIVVVVAVVAAAVKLQATPAPLALPPAAAPPAGPLDGGWQVASGSTAGFRIQQTVIGLTSDVVGRSDDITGTATIAGGHVTAAGFRVNLLALTYGKKTSPQFNKSLDTIRYPDATITMARPVTLGRAFATGATTQLTAPARLTLHGVTHAVSVSLSARRDAANVRITGSIPITFADWGIPRPKGYGWLGSLADHGTAEFLLTLHHS